MAIEMINSIRAAEAEASAIKASVKEEAKNIIAKAKEQSRLQSDKAQADAYEEANAIIEAANKSAEEMSFKQDGEFAAKLEAVKKTAELQLDTAADFILKELFEV